MYTPVFTEPPISWEDWWIGIRRFVNGWYGIPPGGVGRQDPKVTSLGHRLGVELPPAIREWASFADDLQTAGVFGRALRDSFALDWREDLDAVTLLVQGEGDLYWGVRRQNLDAPDPAVDTWLLDGGSAKWSRWRSWTATTSQFALHHLLAYLHGAAGGFSVYVDADHGLLERLARITRTRTELGEAVLFEDVDLVILAGCTLWVPDDSKDRFLVEVELGESRADAVPEPLVELLRDEETYPNLTHGVFTKMLR